MNLIQERTVAHKSKGNAAPSSKKCDSEFDYFGQKPADKKADYYGDTESSPAFPFWRMVVQNHFVGEEEDSESGDNCSSEADSGFKEFPSEEVKEKSKENSDSSPNVFILAQERPDSIERENIAARLSLSLNFSIAGIRVLQSPFKLRVFNIRITSDFNRKSSFPCFISRTINTSVLKENMRPVFRSVLSFDQSGLPIFFHVST